MNRGEELQKAWTISLKACQECDRLLEEFFESFKEIDKDWESYYNKKWFNWTYWEKKNWPFSLPELVIQVYKLRDNNDGFRNFYALLLVFETELLKLLNASEPLIFGAKTKMSKGNYEEYIIKPSAPDAASWFNIFDEEDREETINCFKHKGLPLPDGRVYEYLDEESGEIWEAKIVGCPLVEINNANEIRAKLIKPLFP